MGWKMFGRELTHGNANIKGKIFYWLFGVDILGQRIRAFHVFKMLELSGICSERILDAGSGDGSFCYALSRRHKKARIIGIEIDPVFVQNSRQILSRMNYENVTIKQGDISSNRKDGLFDLIICIDVLEHVPDDLAALQYLYRSLAEGGVLLLHVPQHHQLNRGILRNNAKKSRPPDHVRDEYSEAEITDKIINQGFIIRKRIYTFGFWAALAREMMDTVEGIRFFGPILKVIIFPLALSVSRADLFNKNTKRHQGFLFELIKK